LLKIEGLASIQTEAVEMLEMQIECARDVRNIGIISIDSDDPHALWLNRKDSGSRSPQRQMIFAFCDSLFTLLVADQQLSALETSLEKQLECQPISLKRRA
jgi:flagellar motor component MotA